MDHSYENEKDAVVTEGQNPGYVREEDRGRAEDAVQGRKDAEEDIAEAEKAADEELQHLDLPGNVFEKPADDAAVDQTDAFRNPSE
jgi:hypothetical protein